MSKDKFAILNDQSNNKIVKGAALKENTKKAPGATKKVLVPAFPVDVYDALSENKNVSGESAASFIRRATVKLAREEGII